MSGPLELRQEPGGKRHYLDGRAVHAGELLELSVAVGAAVAVGHYDSTGAGLALSNAVWLRGRYVRPDAQPRFRFELGDGRPFGQCVALGEMDLPEGAVLRWPSKEGSR